MGFNKIAKNAIDLSAIGMRFFQWWPDILIALVQVVPAHLVHTGLKQPLEMRIDRAVKQARHTKLVHIKRDGMHIVEDHRVAQLVIRAVMERLLAYQSRKKHLSQRPAIVEIIE